MQKRPHLIYQLFVGRQEKANIIAHAGQVFTQMLDWPWENLSNLGFDTVYLLGVFDYRGPITVNEEDGINLSDKTHRLPSPFALRDNTLPHPDLGSKEALKALISRLHTAGLAVWGDLVPNHTGTGHPWLTAHPEYYLTDQREFSGDVVKLNYEVMEVRTLMIEVIRDILASGFDGIRADMAHLVPLDFWKQALAEIKKVFPKSIFCAEAYPHSLFDRQNLESLIEAGFDYVYDAPSYQNIHRVIDEQVNVSELASHWQYLLNQNRFDWIYYLANHDDPLGVNVLAYQEGLLAIMDGLPGAVLIENGQLWGNTTRLAHHYYDYLPTSQCELFTQPPVTTLIHSHRTVISAIRTVEPNWLVATITQRPNSGELWLNMAQTEVKLPLPEADWVWQQTRPNKKKLVPPGWFGLITQETSP